MIGAALSTACSGGSATPAKAPGIPGHPDLGVNASLNGKRIFPAGDPWNTPIDTATPDPNSAAILANIGLTTSLHPDFGANYNGGPFGIPYVVVADTTPAQPVPFEYASESDPGPYPIPLQPPIEGGNDNHLLVITQGTWMLYELLGAKLSGGRWSAVAGAIFRLDTNTHRPGGWTSADAAGLPILPGLVRYDEVYQLGSIGHALRFTLRHTRRAWVPPASHAASASTDTLLAPMGMRVRLKASFDIAPFDPHVQVILRALKKYGMMVADNGGDFFLSGTADARWKDGVNAALKRVKVGDFEVVRMNGLVTP